MQAFVSCLANWYALSIALFKRFLVRSVNMVVGILLPLSVDWTHQTVILLSVTGQ